MYTTQIEEDGETGDLLMNIPDELMKEVGWEIGDDIAFIDNKDGTWSMKKAPKTEFILVETIQSYRMRYVVEVPTGMGWAALAKVGNIANDDSVKEFSQKDLGEVFQSRKTLSGKEEVLKMIAEDNPYCDKWNDELKLKTFVTQLDDKGNN